MAVRHLATCAMTVVAMCLCTFMSRVARADDASDNVDQRLFDERYRSAYRKGRSEARYGRAIGEELILLSLGLGWYWLNRETNSRDWDYPNARERFEHLQVRFDTNKSSTDYKNHPLSGSLYYSVARLNGLSIGESFAFTVATSTVYDFVLEWREKPSVNDLIVTPAAGIPIGEFFLHLGDYMHSAPNGGRTIHKVLSYPFGFLQHLHPAKRSINTAPADELGYSSYFGHRFDLMAGAAQASNDQSLDAPILTFDTRAEIVSMPGFLRTGAFSKTFNDGNFTEGRARFAFDGADNHLVDVFFDANLYGHYAQDINTSCGGASLVALNAGMRYVDRNILGRKDFFGIAHLLGPAFKLWAVNGAWMGKLEGSMHLDVAGVRSLAYGPWSEQFGKEGTRSVLQAQHYDHSYGGSARLRGSIGVGGLELAIETFLGRYHSFDRWDRFQEGLTRNVHGREDLVELRTTFAWRVPSTPLQLRIYGDHLGRTSEMSPVTVRRWDRQAGFELGLRL